MVRFSNLTVEVIGNHIAGTQRGEHMARPKKDDRPRPPVTGLRFDRELIKELKHVAVDSERTLTETIEEAMREYLGRKRALKTGR